MNYFVYLTTNLINSKQYVGDHSTNNLNDSYIGSGKYFNDAKKIYGKENFKLKILEFFETKQEAFDAQEKYILLYKTHVSQGGYNISWKGGHQCKNSMSDETKKKISNAKIGKKLSKEHKQKISDAKIGKPSNVTGKKWSDESRKKLSITKIGITHTEEHKQKIKNSNIGKNKGKIRSIETKKKISDAKIGKPSNAKGKKWSDESKAKLVELRKNKPSNAKGKKWSKKLKIIHNE